MSKPTEATVSPTAISSNVRLVHRPRGLGLPGGAFPGWGPKIGSL
jgi:hypothetical protein